MRQKYIKRITIITAAILLAFILTFSSFQIGINFNKQNPQKTGITSGAVTASSIDVPLGGNITVAASDAPQQWKDHANYVCTGTQASGGDAAVIQAAFDALPAQGGHVVLSSGHFYIGKTIDLPDKPWWLSGQGRDVTQLYLINGVNIDMFDYLTAKNVTFSKMSDLSLYGNSHNQTGGNGIYINPGSGSNHLWDAVWENLFIEDFYLRGFHTNDGHDYVFDHVVIEYCGQSNQAYIPALDIVGGDKVYINDCLIKINNGRGCELSAKKSSVQGTSFQSNGESGLRISSDGITVANCQFDTNSYVFQNMYAQLAIDGSNSMILGNYFYSENNYPKYCIQIEKTADSTNVYGNYMTGYGTAAINDIGTNSRFVNNIGYNPVGISSVTVGASPFTYICGSSPTDVIISGGTVSEIDRGIANTGLTSGAFMLQPGQTLVITYSVAPTVLQDIQ